VTKPPFALCCAATRACRPASRQRSQWLSYRLQPQGVALDLLKVSQLWRGSTTPSHGSGHRRHLARWSAAVVAQAGWKAAVVAQARWSAAVVAQARWRVAVVAQLARWLAQLVTVTELHPTAGVAEPIVCTPYLPIYGVVNISEGAPTFSARHAALLPFTQQLENHRAAHGLPVKERAA